MHIAIHIQYMQILVQGTDVQCMNYLIKGLIMTTKKVVDATGLKYISVQDIKLMFAQGVTVVQMNQNAYNTLTPVNKQMLKVCRVKIEVVK